MRGRLRSNLVWIDDVDLVVNDGVADRIFDKPRPVWNTPEPLEVGFVFGEEEFLSAFTIEMVTAKRVMARFDDADLVFGLGSPPKIWFSIIAAPAPGVAKPNSRQQMQHRRIGSAIGRRRANQNVVRRSFRV